VVAGEVVEVEDVGRDGVLREGRGAQLPAAAPPGEGAGEAGADEGDEDDAGAEAEQHEHRARRRAVRHLRDASPPSRRPTPPSGISFSLSHPASTEESLLAHSVLRRTW
jgi:hypothetical protein